MIPPFQILRRGLLALSLLAFSSCAPKVGDDANFLSSTRFSQPPPKIAVATSEPLASAAAVKMVEKGGNIADAAVAASFVISVVRPQATGIGGGGFLLYHPWQTGRTEAWDFRETAPAKASIRDYFQDGKFSASTSLNGAKAVAVPGLVAGLYDFHQAHGKLPWEDVLAPAIEAAEKGFRVSNHFLMSVKARGDVVFSDPELKKLFFSNGTPSKGDLITQPDLARTLKGIAKEGKRHFYEGSFAEAFIYWIRQNGGHVSEADLQNYQVKKREALRGRWKGYQIVTMPPPSSGGLHLIQILKMLEQVTMVSRRDFEAKHRLNSKESQVLLEVEAFRKAFEDRAKYIGDPDFVSIPTIRLMNESYLQERIQGFQDLKPLSSSLASIKEESAETVHLSLMDSSGNAISTTQTHNYYFGAAVAVPGTGVILNNEMDDFAFEVGGKNAWGLSGGKPNLMAPRKRPVSSMTPTIVLDSEGEARMAIGAPGGSKIITAVYLVLARILRDGVEPKKAISDCRFHHQWKPEILELEGQCASRYSKLGKFYQTKTSAFPGEVQAVGKNLESGLYSLVDPRGHGEALLWPRPIP